MLLYQMAPMTIATMVATMIAIQFTCPSSNASYVVARTGDSRDDEHETEPPKRLPDVELRPGPHRDHDVRHKEEVGDVVGQPARARDRLAATGQAARPRELRDDHEGNDAADRHDRDERRIHVPIVRLRTRLARHGYRLAG